MPSPVPALPVPYLRSSALTASRWVDETMLPGDGLNAPAAVVLNGLIYVIGGFQGVSNLPTAEVRTYDPTTKRWAVGAPLPRPRGGHAAVLLDGKIHVFGGGNSSSTISDHSVFDPVANSWTAAAPLPRAEGSPAAVVYRNRIYLIGGRSGNSDFGAVDIYNPATDAWSKGPRITPRGTAGAVVYRGAVYLFGGESQVPRKDVERRAPARSKDERMASRQPNADRPQLRPSSPLERCRLRDRRKQTPRCEPQLRGKQDRRAVFRSEVGSR